MRNLKSIKLIKFKKEIPKFDEEYHHLTKSEIQYKFNQLKLENKIPRIVFLMTVNGRSIRQLFRLIKTIYNECHFYYIHVDEVLNIVGIIFNKFFH